MKKVLIAEDEAAIREIIAITLKRAGYEVTESCDGQQAIDIYNSRNGDFDVVFLLPRKIVVGERLGKLCVDLFGTRIL